ncbi:MAG TPA: hypothetical protein VGH27_16590 [Streptosporangiaceae bacterium]|jgi:hypothetical protein
MVASDTPGLTALLEQWFGKHWATRWEEKLDQMPDGHAAALFIDLIEWVQGLPEKASQPRQPGEVFPAVVAKDGQEWRWLTAALFADRVLVDITYLEPTGHLTYRQRSHMYLRFLTQAIGPALSGHLLISSMLGSFTARQNFEELHHIHQFGHAVDHIYQQFHPTDDDLAEALFLYDAGDFMGAQRACLIPSTEGSTALTELLATRIRRIYGASALKDAKSRNTAHRLSYDYRPALWNQLSVGALPKLTSLDADLFADVVADPRIEQFRRELRQAVGHISQASTAAELADRMAEAQRQISDQARAAQRRAEELQANRWKRVAWQTGGGGLLTALGFLPMPAHALAAALAGSAVSALLSTKSIDPLEPLSGTELTLWRLTEQPR